MSSSDERVEALVQDIADLIACHDMWINDDGEPLDYLPQREALISDFIGDVRDLLDPAMRDLLADAWDEGAKTIWQPLAVHAWSFEFYADDNPYRAEADQ